MALLLMVKHGKEATVGGRRIAMSSSFHVSFAVGKW